MRTVRFTQSYNTFPFPTGLASSLKAIRSFGAAVLLASLISAAHAAPLLETVNVNLTGSGPGSHNLDGTAWDSSVSPLSYDGDVWTDIDAYGQSSLSYSNLSYSDSGLGVSNAGFSLSPFANSYNNGTGLAMLQKGVYSASTMTLTISGLDTGETYNVYLASAHPNYGGAITINGVTKTTSHAQTTSWAESVNYVSFSGIQSNGSGEIVASIAPNGGGLGILNGFQIAAVPEPSSVALLLAGGGTVMVVMRRRSNSVRVIFDPKFEGSSRKPFRT